MKFPFQVVPFSGDILIFGGGGIISTGFRNLNYFLPSFGREDSRVDAKQFSWLQQHLFVRPVDPPGDIFYGLMVRSFRFVIFTVYHLYHVYHMCIVLYII